MVYVYIHIYKALSNAKFFVFEENKRDHPCIILGCLEGREVKGGVEVLVFIRSLR